MSNKFYKLFFFKVEFKTPSRSDILIYDEVGSDVIINNIGQYTFEILHVRYEQINIPVLIRSLWKRIACNTRSLSSIYIDYYIKLASPSLVMTCIDNNISFYEISSRHKSVKTVVIQNGYRANGHLFDRLKQLKKEGLHADYLFLFGKSISKEYSKYFKGEVFYIGSMKNNTHPHDSQKILNSIGFVSQYRNCKMINIGDKKYSFSKLWDAPNKTVLSFLDRYSKEFNKTLFIIPSSKNSISMKSEVSYYKKLLGFDIKILSCDNGYKSIDMCEVSVAVDSTLGYESIARGNKSAIFSLRSYYEDWDDRGFGWPKFFPNIGLFWSNIPDTDYFKKIMDYLFYVSNDDWNRHLKEILYEDVIAYDPENHIFKSILNKEMGTSHYHK